MRKALTGSTEEADAVAVGTVSLMPVHGCGHGHPGRASACVRRGRAACTEPRGAQLNFSCPEPSPWGFPGGVSGKEPACQCRRQKRCGYNPWVGKIPWRRHCYPLQYSCLENTVDRGAWRAMVHSVAESRTRQSDLACTHTSPQSGGPWVSPRFHEEDP